MTPLAAKIFRMSDDEGQRDIARSQFFECTDLVPLAIEMRIADGFKSPFSELAQLPAPFTILEAVMHGRRILFACRLQDDGFIGVTSHTLIGDNEIKIVWQASFLPGAKSYRISGIDTDAKLSEKETRAIVIGLFLIEKMLCIINQPGLVEHKARDTDKRVTRLASARGTSTPALKWHECRIRPGVHGASTASAAGEHREHQLHYVRKHLKPSLGPDRWIEGYWRGNADLGIYLKHYDVQAPRKAA